jgi:hypothetical protein
MANIAYNPADIINKRFGGPGGTAQTSTPEQLAIKQEVLSRGSTIAERSVDLSAISAPPKASAAPVAGSQDIFAGLCESLNQNQQELIKLKQREIADIYDIRFDPPAMGQSTIKRPGDQNLDQAPMRNNATAKKLDKAEDNVNHSAMTWTVKAGSQIVQVIDNVLRNSSYVTDQQIVQISPVADPVTGVQKQTPSPGTKTGTTAWYKITVAVQQLGYDTIIRDHAYRMTFIVAPYAIAQMASQYFPDSRYRGVHKSYQYWFTGNNTQIIQYEQKYSNAYRLTLSGIGADLQKEGSTNFRDQWRKIYMATSENHAQGAKNYTNEPGDNAASFLYDPMSLANVKLRIVGDPAWMQQGEVGLGQLARNFNFSPFLPDGSINYDSQAIMFDVSFNQPTDYDFNTGIVNVNAHNSSSGLPQEHYTYTATRCKNIFSKGRFEQEIEGKLLVEYNQPPATTNGRPATPTATPAAGSRQPATGLGDEEETYTTDSKGNTFKDGTLYRAAEVDEFPASPQPAPPPAAPTSSGDIDFNAGLAGTSSAPQNASAPDKVLATEEETAAVNAYIAAGGTFPRGTGPITSGPLFDNVVAAKAALTARQQASATPATTSTPPQDINRET